MNWYKTATASDFSKWWYLENQKINDNDMVFNILARNGVMVEDIRNWEIQTKTILDGLSLNDAAKLTKQYMIEQKNITRTKRQTVYNNQEKIREEKFIGKDCFLNGYPAKIMDGGTYGPSIISEYSYTGRDAGDVIKHRSWTEIEKHFPHYYGNVFRIYDTEDVLRERIKKEKQRPNHQVKNDLLRVLYQRLKVLTDEKESVDFGYSREDHPPPIRDIRRPPVQKESPYEYVKKQKEEQATNELV
jgi:hypothetical protein